MSDFTLQPVEDMEFDVLIAWADRLGVPHEEQFYGDADTEDALRVAVAEAMEKVGK